MAAAALADSSRLVRIVVPEPLLLQTSQLLQGRLGGLVGRTISHMPFSRRTPTSFDIIKSYQRLHMKQKESSGIILALPEHIMSFELSGLQRLSDERIQEAEQMVKVQRWMRKYSRDILDESDFTLAARTQLIYPSGNQSTVDGHPQRWLIAEALLLLVRGHLFNLQQRFPQSIEVVAKPQGGFPMVYFTRSDVEEEMVALLVKDIVGGQTSFLSTRNISNADRADLKDFISTPVPKEAALASVQRVFKDDPRAQKALYLVRGLLVHRILLLALKKRWNVQYGLHTKRDPIAVPYHAKGVPSEHSEWGHPDVAILLTCLAFYNGGLSLAQLRQGLEIVLKSDDPSVEYERGTQSSQSLPSSLREYSVLNVDDELQVKEIWEHLKYNVTVIDHFLNSFVFPRHAKQFRIKLQASGWDLPLSAHGLVETDGQRRPLTTGFSGTNDNRSLLPLTITQQDLPGLAHTNAEVLTYLLQPRNRHYVLAADMYGQRVSEIGLLQMLKGRNIRMLIDAGAQILELDNQALAKAWLTVDTEAPAALYFDEENKPFVLYRKGYHVPLAASPYADDLGDCLVYLDEAHTRGTDLKMPPFTKGALTLGIGQTKDHTVQGMLPIVTQ